jgi:uronate dehydrogenase
MSERFDTILLTGAAGDLGGVLRRGLKPLARTLRLADIVPIEDAGEGEEVRTFDLADMPAAMAACEGVDAIVHFGGASRERPWETILDATIRGSYHLYEGARKHGARRIVYASSVHAIGFHPLDAHIDAESPVRPDSLYGVSKCFVESLSRLYWDKFGIETACLRIFSSFPEPADRRMLWSWLSHDDCTRLVTAALTAPHVGHSIAFGMSDNRMKPVDDAKAAHLGYRAEDSAEPYREAVEGRTGTPDPMAATTRLMGGWFVALGHPDDGEA